jgi:hypothetical protein
MSERQPMQRSWAIETRRRGEIQFGAVRSARSDRRFYSCYRAPLTSLYRPSLCASGGVQTSSWDAAPAALRTRVNMLRPTFPASDYDYGRSQRNRATPLDRYSPMRICAEKLRCLGLGHRDPSSRSSLSVSRRSAYTTAVLCFRSLVDLTHTSYAAVPAVSSESALMSLVARLVPSSLVDRLEPLLARLPSGLPRPLKWAFIALLICE